MGSRTLTTMQIVCDRCDKVMSEHTGPIISSAVMPNTCEMKVSFPKKDRYGFAETNNSLSIQWQHLCDTCEGTVFKALTYLKDASHEGH